MEGFSNNYEVVNNNEAIGEQNIASFGDTENNIRRNYENNLGVEGAENLALQQYKEQQQLKQQKESPILSEAREELDKQAMINEAKTMLYEKLGIDDNQKNNSSFENFTKGIVDTLILDNYDLAIQVWETNGKVILDGLKQLASLEGLKQVAEAIGESFWSLFTGNAYEKGKAVADIGLVGTGIGAGVYVGKKTVKLGMKQLSKLRKPAERVVDSVDTKKVIGDVNDKVNDIVPKKELDFENTLADNLPEEQLKQLKDLKQSLEDKKFIDNRFPLKEFERLDIDGKLETLGIPREYYNLLNESGFFKEDFVIGRYKKLQYRDKFPDENGNFTNKVIDYQSMINEALLKHPDLTRTEALLIFASTDYFLYKKFNSMLRSGRELTNGEVNLLNTFNNGLDKLPNLPGKSLRKH